jgi:hypothetical protein
MKAIQYVAWICDVNINSFIPAFNISTYGLPINEWVHEGRDADAVKRSIIGSVIGGIKDSEGHQEGQSQ